MVALRLEARRLGLESLLVRRIFDVAAWVSLFTSAAAPGSFLARRLSNAASLLLAQATEPEGSLSWKSSSIHTRGQSGCAVAPRRPSVVGDEE